MKRATSSSASSHFTGSDTHPSAVHERSGRYELFDVIGEGGMARVFLGRLRSTSGFSTLVAIKRPLPEVGAEPAFRRVARREARLAARVRHPNVVSTLDVVDHAGELLIVMEYVHGLPLSALMRLQAARAEAIPPSIGMALVVDALSGLHAAHEASDESGEPLGLVHRDVSPQNILCGVDGLARLGDFGLSRGHDASVSAASGFEGKLTYASPEQVRLEPLSRQSDLFSMGVVAWELASGQRAYADLSLPEIVACLSRGQAPALPDGRGGPMRAVWQVIERALQPDPGARFGSALDMAEALERAGALASPRQVARWMADVGAESLAQRERLLARVEVDGGTPSAAASSEWRRPQLERSGSATLLRPRSLPRLAGAAAGMALALGIARWAVPRPVAVQADSGVPDSRAPLARAPQGQSSRQPAVESAALAAPMPPRPAPSAVDRSRPVAVRTRQLGRRFRSRVAPPSSRRPATRVASPAGAAVGDCDPPYSIDREGIRHPRPGCL